MTASGVEQQHAATRHLDRPVLHPWPHERLRARADSLAMRGTLGRPGERSRQCVGAPTPRLGWARESCFGGDRLEELDWVASRIFDEYLLAAHAGDDFIAEPGTVLA